MGKYFGTDGVRAVAGQFPLVDDFIEKLGFAALRRLQTCNKDSSLKPQVIVAQDSRASGPAILAALEKGIRASGANVISVGIAPTPCVAYLVKQTRSLCGVVISASHNPSEFNGIKFFTYQGTKLPEEMENAIEREIETLTSVPTPTGKFTQDENLVKQYEQFLMSTVDASLLKDTKIVLDCANGASYKVAANVFAGLGMNVTVTAAKPDGTNINNGCGSTHIEKLQAFVVEKGLDVGFAYDGDADRCFAVDNEGNLVDGDKILYICGKYMKEHGELKGNKVVTTVMSNIGLYKAFDKVGIEYEKTAVGDKYVNECMVENGYSLGGEQSGHIIFSKYATTGDGILTSLMIMEVILESKMTLAEVTKDIKIYPQLLVNVKVSDKEAAMNNEKVLKAIADKEASLEGEGRILVRPSGTEPVIRVMAEAPDDETCKKVVDEIIDVLKSEGIAQ